MAYHGSAVGRLPLFFPVRTAAVVVLVTWPVICGGRDAPPEFRVTPGNLKPRRLDTVLVEGRQPRATIVVPADPAVGAVGRWLQQRVLELTGARLPMVLDGALRAEDKAGRNLIALGSLENNRLVAELYRTYYVFPDAAHPHGDRHLLRSVHDPFGTGNNVLVLGGSTPGGVRNAARDLLARVARSSTCKVGRLHEPDTPLPPGAGDRAQAQARQIVAQWPSGEPGRTALREISSAGLSYELLGDPYQLALYRASWLAYLEATRDRPATRQEWLMLPITAWDLAEEDPVFSDEERVRISNALLEVARASRRGWARRLEDPSALPWGHQLDEAMCLLALGLYFDKYYHLAEAREWIDTGRAILRRTIPTWREQTDSDFYFAIVAHSMLADHALRTGDFAWFENGNARRAADYLAASTDNLGMNAGFGDAAGVGRVDKRRQRFWRICEWFYGGGRYQWLLTHLAGAPAGAPGEFTTTHAPTKPEDLLGTRAAPLAEAVYRFTLDGRFATLPPADEPPRRTETPPEQAFDKISFRTDFAPDRQYLLLDGTARGSHAHLDANAIVRMTDNGRVWLTDSDYREGAGDVARAAPGAHSMLVVSRDGREEEVPPLASLEASADFRRTGFTRTALRRYGGVDWLRNVLWNKEEYFLVVDEILAREGGEFTLDCRFRTLGTATLAARALVVEQQGERFSIASADGAQLLLEDDESHGRRKASDYPFAPPVTRVLRAVREVRLAPGEGTAFVHLLVASSPREPHEWRIERRGETAVLLRSAGGEVVYAGSGRVEAGAGPDVPAVSTDAALFQVAPTWFALVKAQGLSVGPDRLLGATAPVSIELDWLAGKAVVEADGEAEVRVPAADLLLDGRPVATAGSVRVPPGRHEIGFRPVPSDSPVLDRWRGILHRPPSSTAPSGPS